MTDAPAAAAPDPAADPFAPRRSLLPWILAIAFLGMIVLGVALASRFGTDPNLVASPLIGKAAPDVKLPYLEQEGELALADLRGDIVVVNFWASWCLPCRQEHPELVAAAAAYEDAGVRFVGITYQDRRDAAQAFLDDLGRGYTYLDDERSRAAIAFGVFGIPETFFIDRDGVVVGNVRGAVDGALLASALDTILVGGEIGSVDQGPVESRE